MNKSSRQYKNAIKKANRLYGQKSSAYRSMYIVKEYKRSGGKFTGKKPNPKQGLRRWNEKEEWIQVIPYLTQKKRIECGAGHNRKGSGTACRPLVRVSWKTPITLDELLKRHRPSDILNIAKMKEKYPEKTVYWASLRIV